MACVKTLELFNPNADKLDIVKLQIESIDDKHEKDNKQAIDELIKVLKEEFNMQKADDRFLKEVYDFSVELMSVSEKKMYVEWTKLTL